uniref:AB hydrolase-1 domain-containing protein n=1 Tax=Lactuca sativa TaxID=4236 RepID=A0A9R1XUB4_LACSA|nr:hypothetical protein LSAT_V11C100027280 [Lactuca sativa]
MYVWRRRGKLFHITHCVAPKHSKLSNAKEQAVRRTESSLSMASTASSTLGLPKLHFPQSFTHKISSSSSTLPRKTRVPSISSKPSRIISICSCLTDSSSLEAVEAIIPKYAGNSGPALVLVHGFGANSDHWRKNIPVLAESNRVFSIDLIGYGYSDKPNPRDLGDTPFYTFETWGSQINDFCTEIVKDQAFFICNSIGGLVGLQAAVTDPSICKGIVLLNISLRMLHITKQPWFGRPLIRSFQNLLRNTPVGKFFFQSVATRESVKNILCQCYHDTSQVTEELVDAILLPGLEPGAADVFLEFICYSDGPLPEELLPLVKCPVLVAWGDKDPWEPVELGKAYGQFDIVEDFVVLPDVGHCPQDEAPHLVNPLVESFIARHATMKS